MRARHGNLTANQVVTIDLGTIPSLATVYVANVTQNAPFYVRLDGVDPEVYGDDSRIVFAFRRFSGLQESWDGSPVSEVKIISAQDGQWAVEVGR